MSNKIEVDAAWAESCAGPGWSNTPIWYVTRDGNGVLQKECLQPEQQNKDMRLLFGLSAQISSQMRRLVQDHIDKPKSRKAQ